MQKRAFQQASDSPPQGWRADSYTDGDDEPQQYRRTTDIRDECAVPEDAGEN